MIVVGSIPRSGSSLMMQILSKMGYPPHGHEFPPGIPAHHNPGGFYEFLPHEWAEFTKHFPYEDNGCVKFMPWNYRELERDRFPMIVTVRKNWKAQTKSLMRVLPGFTKEGAREALRICFLVNMAFAKKGRHLVVPLEEIQEDPKTWVERVAEFIGYSGNLTQAINLIKPCPGVQS